jgi:crotonobetainyl-CoA:carnitine CoA-transferase CaiB-like acyl-CoA transferase
MLGVAMMMQASLMAGYFRNGAEPKPHGNKQPYATNSAYDAKEGMVMIGASNIRQQARFWRAVGREDMIKTDNEARIDEREREAAVIAEIIKTKTADEWEVYFQARHVPAARVRTMADAIADPHFKERRVFHHFEAVPGIDGPVGVPLAAFKFAHGGPSIEHPPHEMGQDTDAVLGELGYSGSEIVRLREMRVV